MRMPDNFCSRGSRLTSLPTTCRSTANMPYGGWSSRTNFSIAQANGSPLWRGSGCVGAENVESGGPISFITLVIIDLPYRAGPSKSWIKVKNKAQVCRRVQKSRRRRLREGLRAKVLAVELQQIKRISIERRLYLSCTCGMIAAYNEEDVMISPT